MIQQLIQLIINQLVAGLTGVITNPATRITQGPITRPTQAARPRIILEADRIDWSQTSRDDTTGRPRNLGARERIPMNLGVPAGPYTLGNQPLAGTVQATVVFHEGQVDEYADELLPDIDFTVNVDTRQLTVIKPIAGASALRVAYTFIGNAAVREFQQLLNITLYLDGWADLNRLSGLTSTVVQSQQQLLLDQFNFQSPTSFTANGYFCSVALSRIELVSMTLPARTTTQALSDVVVVLNLRILGTEQMGKSLSGGFGLLESIHTRGEVGPGVNIVPNVG